MRALSLGLSLLAACSFGGANRVSDGGGAALPGAVRDAAGSPASPADETAAEVARHRQAAFAALRTGHVLQARDAWAEALRLTPDDPYLLSNLGMAEDAMGNHVAAMEAAGRAAQRHPDSPALAVNYGLTLAHAGLGGQAVAEFRRALERDPDFVPAHLALGYHALERGEPSEALRSFDAAIKAAPDAAAPYAGRGVAHARMGQWEPAGHSFARAWSLAPAVPLYAAAAGGLFARAGNDAEAVRLLDAAVAAERPIPEAMVLRAELAWRHKDHERARELLDAALARHPEDVTGVSVAGTALRRGQLAYLIDEAGVARQALIRAAAEHGQPPAWKASANGLLGALALSKRNFELAERRFARALEFADEEPAYLAGLAVARHGLALRTPEPQRETTLAEVETLYRKAIEGAENPRLRVHLGRLYMDQAAIVALPYRRGKLHQAETQLREALARQPGLVEGHLRLGMLLADLRRLGEARSAYAAAARLDPDNSRIAFLHANFLRRYGPVAWQPAAHAEFSRALKLDPRYVEAQIGWYLTRPVAAAQSKPRREAGAGEAAETMSDPAVTETGPEVLAPDAIPEDSVPIDPPLYGEEETGESENLEDLLPFLMMPEDDPFMMGPEEEGDPSVIPIKEDDRTPIYSIGATSSTGPSIP